MTFNFRNYLKQFTIVLNKNKKCISLTFRIETTDSPKEAGLMFACRNPNTFIGKEKLKLDAKKRRVIFSLSPDVPLNGTEAIFRHVLLFFGMNELIMCISFLSTSQNSVLLD